MHELRWYEYPTNSWEIWESQIIFGKKIHDHQCWKTIKVLTKLFYFTTCYGFVDFTLDCDHCTTTTR
jgi:hypothetical protein